MRITTSMMSSKYIKNLNKSESDMNYLNEQVSTGRKFFKGSEDPVSAIKAYKLRREYRSTEIYDTNISDVDSFLTTAETNLTEISDNLETVYTSYLKGINGTMSSDDREIIAKELENLQNSILTSLNAKFADRYVFGGTSKDEIPFTVDEATGELFFKGVNVNSGDMTTLNQLSDEVINIDIGLGMTFDEGGKLNQDTVFNMSMSGINFMGYGSSIDENGENIPNNLYTLVGKIKDKLKSSDFSIENITPYIEEYEDQKKQVLVSITDIGAKTNYLDFLKVRNEDNQFNINEKLVDVEEIDSAEAIIDFKMQEYSYNAALSMGNKILQNSFIDFMK
ncbi:MAG: flagellar hook-associated protein FlgL [Sedimentibacter sp.]|uniref:flagellar hook-associated protein FlgL n=1 Tax=Sedimentibacter sp. TaxID=1960295 RepID=UPI00298198D8|nr:flagellar hook-associated protein FlgL [Sedimentibacter sp.]MDW5300101.1 flagellar hook-associated protein FlgL [Sedimentibacter sp.]